MLALQTNATLEDLGPSVDKLHEILQSMHVSTISKSSNNTTDIDIVQQISDLTKQLAALSAIIHKWELRSNTRQHNKPRSRSRSHAGRVLTVFVTAMRNLEKTLYDASKVAHFREMHQRIANDG